MQLQKNPDGTYSEIVLVPIDPVAIQSQIDNLKAQQDAAVQLAKVNATNQFQSEIDTLQTQLDDFNASLK